MSYELVCGLEVHVELNVNTKIFCSCTTKFGGAPNTQCCPICTGMPGVLPRLNEKVVCYAIKAGLALNCEIADTIFMDRKNYFYPDLPKAYQISQFDKPLCYGGYVTLDSGKRIGITRIHIEEDAGKLVHENGFTFIDYNRCGIPLIEIVSEPSISSSEEAREYVEKLQQILRYINVSDCKMQQGSIRADVNVSIKKKSETSLGVRTEIKNLNSLSFLEKGINYEFNRQKQILASGGKVERQTLRFDEKTCSTQVMRTKEDTDDYRFFREPDILPIKIEREYIQEIKKSIPELPNSLIDRFVKDYSITRQNARLICKYKKVAEFFDKVCLLGASGKISANLILGTVFSKLSLEEEREDFKILVDKENFAKLVKYVDNGYLFNNAQNALLKMLETGKCVDEYVRKEDVEPIREEKLREICKLALDCNKNAIQNYKNGNVKAINAVYGFVIKNTQGKVNIKRVEEIIKELIDKL